MQARKAVERPQAVTKYGQLKPCNAHEQYFAAGQFTKWAPSHLHADGHKHTIQTTLNTARTSETTTHASQDSVDVVEKLVGVSRSLINLYNVSLVN